MSTSQVHIYEVSRSSDRYSKAGCPYYGILHCGTSLIVTALPMLLKDGEHVYSQGMIHRHSSIHAYHGNQFQAVTHTSSAA